MNGGPSAPTAADYANDAAQSARRHAERLEERVGVLEATLRDVARSLQGSRDPQIRAQGVLSDYLARIGDGILESLARLPR